MNMTQTLTPAEIARTALLTLASEKKPPTPDNYRDAYAKIMGTPIKQQKTGDPDWRSLLMDTLRLQIVPSLQDQPDLSQKVQKLLDGGNDLSPPNYAKLLKECLLAVEMQRETQRRTHEAILNLLRLTTRSMGEMVLDDEWLNSQIKIIEDILSKPVNINTLYDAESSLNALILKQTQLKPSLRVAKDTLKSMATTFVESLASVTENTDEYHGKIEGYQQQLRATEEISALNNVLENILADTKSVSLNVQRAQIELHQNQQKAQEAEQKIKVLTAELDHINEVAHEDYLTGTLNRRGMDEALDVEFTRADRFQTPLSIAMMDIDHFKRINDQLGHAKGDEALTHFAKVVKKVKRSTDVLARYGGEEFIIILPGTNEEDAINVITRMQRELTKNFFLHENDRVLITFSAGVAERTGTEKPEEIIPRADAALYEAKNSGRNRVIGSQSLSTHLCPLPKPLSPKQKLA